MMITDAAMRCALLSLRCARCSFSDSYNTVVVTLRSTIQPLQRVMNAWARAVMALSSRDHVKPALKQLRWLPVEQRISYKLCLLMHNIHTGQAPQYLSNCVSMISSSGNRCRLRSCDTADYILPRTRTKFGERGFHWNTLPSDLHDITDTNAFKKRLKTVLFDRTYWLIIVVVRRSSTVRKAAPCKSLIVFVLYCIVRAHVWPRSDTIHVIIVCDW